MIRDHALGFAAILAAILSVGGALAIAQAQDNTPKTTNAAQNRPGTRPAGGHAGPAAGTRMPPGAMPGMGRAGISSMLSMGSAVDDDPEMNELAQTEAALANESAEIIARFAEAEKAADRKQLAAELKATLAKQFDVQKKRREIELSRIEERVRKLREQIKKRDDARETIIDRRLDQLVDDADGLGWSPPTGPARRGSGPGSTTGTRGAGGGSTPKARTQ
jgi:hypothetical protein